jgi:hypothetical protein
VIFDNLNPQDLPYFHACGCLHEPKQKSRNEPNLIVCFQQKLKMKANFPPGGGRVSAPSDPSPVPAKVGLRP